MSEYRVVWVIDVDADSPEDAAAYARDIQQNPDSIATVFQVTDTDGVIRVVDLRGDY